MTIPIEERLKELAVGQTVRLAPGSPIYRGPYDATVVARSAREVRVSVPLDRGKLVLLPVGTRVRVARPGASWDVEMQIVERTGGRQRSLLLSLPEPKKVSAPPHSAPVIAVSSGKGGVGKTTFVANLGIALSRLGKTVCVIDGDLGTANVDVLLNLSPEYNLAHVVRGEKHMLEVVVEGPEGLIVLPGGSGFQELTTLSDEAFSVILRQFYELERYADMILIDTGSGLSPSVTNFLLPAPETILVTTPEPHAITDCYALIKVLATQGYRGKLRLVVNRTESEAEGNDVARKMVFASQRFLHMELEPIGVIFDDPAVSRSIRRQRPVVLDEPRSSAALQIARIAERILGTESDRRATSGSLNFFERMRRLIPIGRVQV